MLRRTQIQHFFMWQKGVDRSGGGFIPHNKDINKMIIAMKERGKTSAYYGTYMMRNPDREMWWNAFANPRTARFYLKRSFSEKQYYHYNNFHDRYALHIVQKSPHQGIGGGIFRCIWDNTIGHTNSSFSRLKNTMKNCDRDSAVHTMETFGIRTILLDDRRTPKPGDFHAIRHALYSHNFPWIKDPGNQPDYQWQGDDAAYDYTTYGAQTKSARNAFQSQWATENAGVVGSSSSGPAPTILDSKASVSATDATVAAAAKAEKKAKAPKAKSEKPSAEKKAEKAAVADAPTESSTTETEKKA